MVLRGIGRCPALFWMAISLDVAGLSLLLIGIFANLRVGGRGVGDCLVYSGAIVVFFSLIWWLTWCTGNIEVSLEELEKDSMVKERSLAKLAREFSERLSVKRQKSPQEAAKLEKETELGLREIATVISWDMHWRFSEVPPHQRQEPRYVELSNVRRPPHLPPTAPHNGERLV